MKCDVCKKDTHIVHIDDSHRKCCPGCYLKRDDESSKNNNKGIDHGRLRKSNKDRTKT